MLEISILSGRRKCSFAQGNARFIFKIHRQKGESKNPRPFGISSLIQLRQALTTPPSFPISGATPDALFPARPAARRKASAGCEASSPLSILPAAAPHPFSPIAAEPFFLPAHKTPWLPERAILFPTAPKKGKSLPVRPATPTGRPAGQPEPPPKESLPPGKDRPSARSFSEPGFIA